MKKTLFPIMVFGIIFGLTVTTNATFIDRGRGLIYDTDLNITWLQDANYSNTSGYDSDGRMTWTEAKTWAENLVYGGYSDWRLPKTVEGSYGSGDFGYDGASARGYNITTSEMGYMYYVNLGNKSYFATDETSPQPGWGLKNTGPFINLQTHLYWSDTETSLYSEPPFSTSLAWIFSFGLPEDFNYFGWQDFTYKDYPFYAWAVRTGDVAAVPEPSTMLLLGSGLLGLWGMRKKFKK